MAPPPLSPATKQSAENHPGMAEPAENVLTTETVIQEGQILVGGCVKAQVFGEQPS